VTAAKKYLYGEVGIDGLAGASEVLVVADETADPEMAAADLLAQAEHDVAAVPMLIVTSEAVGEAIVACVGRQLSDLTTASTAKAALDNGFWLVTSSLKEAIEASNEIAPEHLALHLANAEAALPAFTAYGSVFVGEGSAEAFADYGAGPNHVLPTAGGARYQSGLSVMSYLRSPTWLRLDDPRALIGDTDLLAMTEGLEGHAKAALSRDRGE
jgi:phosphoribosyl-ATP pyrophosphohydrolase/phosphoribosyl-AMP cyclohydrolase/histidinol dehydrogenase